MTRTAPSTPPGDNAVQLARRAARRVRDYLASHPTEQELTIRGELNGDDALVVPREAAVLFAQVLGYLAEGKGVQVMPAASMLTTQQAADFLNVSRPYLIKLLESGAIPFEKVGTHRRIAFGDLIEYKARDHQQRREAADELSQLSQELDVS